METHCAHPKTRARSASALAAALGRAEALCVERGGRWTRPRHKVLERLLQASGPVKAYDLMAGMGEGDAAAKPPTVYRALDFLERQGFGKVFNLSGGILAWSRVIDPSIPQY